MILREATAADLSAILALCRKQTTSPKRPILTDLDRLRAARSHRWRIVVARNDRRVLAVLSALPTDTADGPGYTIDLYAADRDEPDPTLALEAVSLYACHLANSEGRHVILSRRPATTGPVYGRDVLAMQPFDHGDELLMVGDARTIAGAIVGKRPQWRLSL